MILIFQRMLSISIPIIQAIFIVGVIRKVFNQKVSSRLLILMWIPILIQLCVPYRYNSHIKAMSVSSLKTMIPDESIFTFLVRDRVMSEMALTQGQESLNWNAVLMGVWLCGFIVLVGFYGIRRILVQRSLNHAVCCQDERVAQIMKQQNLKLDCVVSQKIKGAALWTGWPSKLMIQEDLTMITEDELVLMIAHEAGHYHQHHGMYLFLFKLIQCIYWFNPAVALMMRWIQEDLEFIVDEIVISQVPDKIEEYAQLMIRIQCVQPRFSALLPMSGAAQKIKERIKKMMNKKYKLALAVSAVAASIAFVALVILPKTTLPKQAEITPTPMLSSKEAQPQQEIENIPQEKLKSVSFTTEIEVVLPVDNAVITCGWGCYYEHKETDVKNEVDRYGNVYAFMKGTVIKSEYDKIKGNYIVLDHGNGYQSAYGHLEKRDVTEGDQIEMGEIIGQIGMTGEATGPHVGFEVSFNNEPMNVDYLFQTEENDE